MEFLSFQQFFNNPSATFFSTFGTFSFHFSQTGKTLSSSNLPTIAIVLNQLSHSLKVHLSHLT